MNSDVFSGVGHGTWARTEKRLGVQATIMVFALDSVPTLTLTLRYLLHHNMR